MRLFRKIYLRVLSGILLFALTIPGYLLWETEKQSLQGFGNHVPKPFQKAAYIARRISNRYCSINRSTSTSDAR